MIWYFCLEQIVNIKIDNNSIFVMEKDKKEDGSFVNEDLDNAFVEGELNKTVTANSNENSNWNLLDDPEMENVKKEE